MGSLTRLPAPPNGDAAPPPGIARAGRNLPRAPTGPLLDEGVNDPAVELDRNAVSARYGPSRDAACASSSS
jgi:hypothetical protein